MTYDPDKNEEERALTIEEKIDEALVTLKRIARLLEILADTEVTPEDVEE